MTAFAAVDAVAAQRPDGWKVVEFRRLFSLVERFRGEDESSPVLSLASSGVVSARVGDGRQPPSEEYLRRYNRVRPGELVVNPLWLIGGAIGVSEVEGCVSPEYRVYRLPPPAYPRYWHYLLRSQPYRDQYNLLVRAQTTFDRRISKDDFHPLPLLMPPAELQRRIATFLDAETARIDSIVERRRAITAALSERAELAIASLVLTGAPRGEIEATGEAYLPATPNGWRRTTLRHLRCLVQTGPFGSQLHADEYVADGWPVVNPSNLKNGRIQPDGLMTVTAEKRSELRRHVLQPGDIVFGRRGEMGRAGLVTALEAGWLCGTGSLLVRPADDRLSSEYLKLLLETPPLRAYFGIESVGSTMDNLNSDIVLGSPIFLPPRDAQLSIVERVRELREHLDTAQDLFRRQVDAMNEHRQALITAAVTGQLDVTKGAA